MEPALTTRGPWPTATKQTPDGDSKLSKASDSVEGDQVREKTDAQTEQLQQLHWSQQQQLDREQLNQLKAFKNQLMNDVITQLSPRSGPQEDIVGTGQRYSCFDTHQLSLSLEEAGHLLSPLFTHPIHHSAAPPGLFTPIRLPTSITAINHVSPSSSPPRSSLATTTPSRTNPPVTTELCASNLYSTPPQAPLNQHTLQVHIPERSQVALPSTLSPDLSVVCPQLPVPSSSPHSTPPTITCTPGPILPAGTANSHSQQLSISRTSPHTVGHTISPTARSTMPLPLPQNTQGTPNTHSAVKTTLIEKHARHVEDLKQYYESKLEELQRELNLSSEEKPLTSPLSHAKSPDCESNERLQSSIATRLQYANLPSPGLSATERAHKRLQAENDRLKAECTNLKIKLKQHDMYVYCSPVYEPYVYPSIQSESSSGRPDQEAGSLPGMCVIGLVCYTSCGGLSSWSGRVRPRQPLEPSVSYKTNWRLPEHSCTNRTALWNNFRPTCKCLWEKYSSGKSSRYKQKRNTNRFILDKHCSLTIHSY